MKAQNPAPDVASRARGVACVCACAAAAAAGARGQADVPTQQHMSYTNTGALLLVLQMFLKIILFLPYRLT